MAEELSLKIATLGVFENLRCSATQRALLKEIHRLMVAICTNAEKRGQTEVVEDFKVLCIEPQKRLEMRRAGQ